MYKFTLLFSLLFVFSTQLLSQRMLRGSGNIITQERSLDGFEEVSIRGAIKATVRQGKRFSVSIEADDNVMEHVESFVSGGKLVIKMRDRGSYNNTTVRVSITLPSLTGVYVSGASRLVASGFNQSGERMDVSVSGASYLEIKNSSARDLDLVASGASSIDLSDFSVAMADINFSGASSAKLSVDRQVTGKASGASSVRVSGGASINVKTSGASRVR